MDVRRRSAPRAESSSDVTRFRGLWQACALAGAAVVLVVLVQTGRDALRGAPGELAWPHARAGLSCAMCHGAERVAPLASACKHCHGPRQHTRVGHAAQAAAGTLACSNCHREHIDHGGVIFAPDGSARRYGLGTGTIAISGLATNSAGYRPKTQVTVPVIPAATCARCHHIDDPGDPASACVLEEQRALGEQRPTICFDEHRPVAAVEPGVSLLRDPAWEAAREAVSLVPRAPGGTAGRGRAPVWVILAVLFGLGVYFVPRVIISLRAGRKDRRERERAALVAPPRERKLPTINTSTCIGCYACVDACPYDVLAIRDYVATVARPADCCGLTLCEQRCPNGSLRMGDGQPITDSPVTDERLQSQDVVGLYLAGDITGLPLIRNAINQGAHAARSVARDLARAGKSLGAMERDVVIVGAGPAGLSAALAARAAGLDYVVLEQQTVAASVSSFPRGKLVFDQPLELPLIGDLWLQEATKEELLGQWLRIVRRHELIVREHTRVTAIAPLMNDERSRAEEPAGFIVSAATSAGGAGADDVESALEIRARRVIVAIGRRGSPRRLAIDIPGEMAERVFYSLADARSFAGQQTLVVGLGDVAMEAAIALSRQPGTAVTVSYRGADFRRGKARTIAEFRRRMDAGAIRALFSTEVVSLMAGRAELASAEGLVTVACDAVFVLIGSIPPSALLREFGLRVVALADSDS